VLLIGLALVTPERVTLRGTGRAALVGYVCGLATFLPMLHWITVSVGGAAGGVVGVLAWIALCAFLSTWHALAASLVAPWVHTRWVIGVLPVVWTGTEAWRNQVPLTGFGWGSYADAQADTVLLPLARVLGGHGLTLAVALIGALLFVTGREYLAGRRLAAGAVALGLVATVVVGGLAPPAAPAPDGPSLDVLMVQGNDIEEPFPGTAADKHVAIAARMIAETRSSVDVHGQPDLTVWPESAIDRDPFGSGGYLLPYLEEGARIAGGGLLAGAVLDGPEPTEQFENSLLLVAEDGEVLDRYLKRRYVPFGEYVPWRDAIRRLVPAVAAVPRDGVSGDGPSTIRLEDGTEIAPIICFETLFPDVVRTNVLAGDVGLIVTGTNDAAFGRTAEPDQHVAQSRIRAVENGRWVVHAALSGSSALITADGEVLTATDIFVRDTIRSDVPVITGSTPYLVLGDVTGSLTRWGSAGLLLLLVGAQVRRSRSDLS
jgi:apolipoprotein N-acyltransferase